MEYGVTLQDHLYSIDTKGKNSNFGKNREAKGG